MSCYIDVVGCTNNDDHNGIDKGDCPYCEIDRLTTQLAERDAEIALLRKQSVGWVQVFDENAALRAEVAALKQVSAELCPDCGWAMKFPDEPCCKCEVERLKLIISGKTFVDERKQTASEMLVYLTLNAVMVYMTLNAVISNDGDIYKDIKSKFGLEG